MNRSLSLLTFALFAFVSPSEGWAAKRKKAASPFPAVPWARVERELKQEGFKKPFIQALRKHYQRSKQEKVLTLNILSFLGTRNHMELVTPLAVERTQEFLARNAATLADAEREYGVPSSVIAALLWIETRHGAVRGDFHVPSVYLTLYLAKEKSFQKALDKIAQERGRGIASSEEISTKVEQRSNRKSAWALSQLKAIAQWMPKQGKRFREFKGSFAGAFGIPQFIPESFLKWAVSPDNERTPDLNRPDDAIYSVANYLKRNGWKPTAGAPKVALMHYNNSSDYAEAILEISRKAVGGRDIATADAKASD